MSRHVTSIKTTKPNLDVTSFYGGVERGPCLQLTQETGFVQVSLLEAKELALVLSEWVSDERRQGK